MRTLFDLMNGKSQAGRCRPSQEWSSPPAVITEDYVHLKSEQPRRRCGREGLELVDGAVVLVFAVRLREGRRVISW